MNAEQRHNCQCHCGMTRFSVHAQPILRGFCHCTICQAFNEAAYADITIFRRRDIAYPEDNQVAFKAHRWPPLLQRGRCIACEQAAVEFLRMPLMPELAIIPTANIADGSYVPAPALHIFYDHRAQDADDALPKYAGYARSQLALGRRIVAAMLHG